MGGRSVRGVRGVPVVVTAGVAATVLLGGCGSSSNSSTSASPTSAVPPAAANSAPAGQLAVTIKDLAFNPGTLQARVGQTVTVTNQDSVPHDWTDKGGAFNSPTLNPGETFTYTFTKAGTFNVYCTIHPFMKQTVVVS